MDRALENKFGDGMLAERYGLVKERILLIRQEQTVKGISRDFFQTIATFLLEADRIFVMGLEGKLPERSLDECRNDHDILYTDIMPVNYGTSYCNPAYAAERMGKPAGKLLSFLASELRAGIAYVFEGKIQEWVILLELFVQIYNCFEESEEGNLKEAEKIIYWFFHDYSEVFVESQIHSLLIPEENFFIDIIQNADLSDPRYLYRYGLPIGENELGIAAFLNEMPEEQVQAMADTFTEGYRIGFVTTGKDLGKKKTVSIHYAAGFERMIRAAIRNFEKMGLRPTISREPISSFQGKGNGKRGAYSSSVNRQYDFDHREDKAIYLDKSAVERRLELLRTVFESYRKEASVHAGPAVLEVFGEEPFSPETKEEAWHLSDKQQQLSVYQASLSGQITNEFIPGEERSFTIIAYPVPEIGSRFREIFAETVRVNTLDYKKYQDMQQRIIDVLDQAGHVRILGRGKNHTDLCVSIWPIKDPEKETAFENCVADVNIPVGEVFTSPVLEGTTGVLHVTEVFLNGLKYENLEFRFQDGMITDYACSNFENEDENRKYIKDNILMHHDTLPMGEFAIGTNTTAYRMGKKYGIAAKLPILIAEKTGPHFAVGDTCYSHAEDTAVFNPDGKEIMPRDNAITLKRQEDMSAAYFNCHTDITIPYEELDSIYVIKKDKTKEYIIKNGFFCVPGTEDLNIPLEDIE